MAATSTRAWTRSLLWQPVRLPVDGRGRTTGDELRTTGARHPVQKERQEASGFAASWEDFDVIERACGRDVREGLLR